MGPYGSLIPCTVSKKTNKWIPKKVCYKQRNELTDRPTDRFKFMGPCKGSKRLDKISTIHLVVLKNYLHILKLISNNFHFPKGLALAEKRSLKMLRCFLISFIIKLSNSSEPYNRIFKRESTLKLLLKDLSDKRSSSGQSWLCTKWQLDMLKCTKPLRWAQFFRCTNFAL